MTEKTKRFPLPLASLSANSNRSGAHGGRPDVMNGASQTAARNAALHLRNRESAIGSSKMDGAQNSASGAIAGNLVSDSIRKAMVARIAAKGVVNSRVLAAMEAVPRHLFIEPALASQSYIDASLPIGHHQTISQPYIVARMIELLCEHFGTQKPRKILEIGTGCGYQAAVLSLVAEEVYSIERIRPLHELAKTNLRPMRIPNIRLHYGDGMLGLPQAGPFDGIILAAAGMEVPRTLLEQMAIKGRLVAPVGSQRQVLHLYERVSQTEWSSMTVEDCHFVPLRPGTVS